MAIPNSNPTVLNPIADQQAIEDVFFSISIKNAFTDRDGDALTFSADQLPDGLSLDAGTGIISGIPTNAAVGNQSINITASDGQGGTVSTTFKLTVVNTNDDPIVQTPIPNQTANEDEVYSLDVTSYFKDMDIGDVLTYSATGLPTGLTLDANSGLITGSPTNAAVGTRTVTITAKDKSGRTVSTGFSLAVVNTNDAPTVATAIADRSINEDSPISFSVRSNFGDIDLGDTLTFSANGLPEGLTINKDTGIISGSATNNAVGDNTVTIIASDQSGASISSSFKLTVVNTNDDPIVQSAIPNQTANEDEVYNLDVTSYFKDIDIGDVLTYSAAGLPTGLTLDANSGLITGSPTNAAVGTRTVTITAKDKSGRTVSTGFSFAVVNTNDAPTVATAIADRSINEDSPISFSVRSNFGDIDSGDVLTFSAEGLPEGLTINKDTGIISGSATNNAVGDTPITVIATDKSGAKVSDVFVLTVVNTNDAPIVHSPIVNQTADEDDLFTLDITPNFKDIDLGDVLTYTATGLPNGLTLNLDTGIISGRPTNAAVGTRNVTVTVKDKSGRTVSTAFSFTILNTNDAPTVATAIADRTASEDAFFSMNVKSNFADIDVGDTLIYFATGLPDGLSINQTTGVISGTPTNTAVGRNNIIITASDSKGGTASAAFALTVANTNDVPTAAAIPDQTMAEDGSISIDISSYFKDIDLGDTLSFTASGLPDGLSIDSSTGIISGSPTNAAVGKHDVMITANDGKGGKVSDTFAVTVVNTNDDPTLKTAIGDKAAIEDQPFTLNISGNFSDIDVGNALTFYATGLPNGLSINPETGTITGSPTNTAVGINTVTIIADDGNGGTASDTFKLTVTNSNDAPTLVTPIPDQAATEDDLFSLDITGYFTDLDDGDTLTYTATGLPDGLSLDKTTGLLSGTPTNAAVGTRNITITADDGKGGKISDTLTLAIANTNDDPTVKVAIGDKTAIEDKLFSLNISSNFNDIDLGDSLTFYATGLPDGLSLDSAKGIISGSPTNAAVGINSITVIADDGKGGTVSDTFKLTIINSNDAPTLAEAIPDQSATEDSAFSLDISSYFSDIDDGDILTYSTSGLPDGLSLDKTTGILSGTPSNAAVGPQGITITADDGKGGKVSDTFVLTTANMNDEPLLLSAIGKQTATQGLSFTLNLNQHFGDPDKGDRLRYLVNQLPSGLSLDTDKGTISGVATVLGTTTISITADDSNGGIVSDTFELTVAANEAPKLVQLLPDQTVLANRAFSFAVANNSFLDANVGDALTLKATLQNGSALPGWLKFNAATGQFSGLASSTNLGTVAVKVTATDRQGLTTSDVFNLTVNAPPPEKMMKVGTNQNDRLIGTVKNDILVGLKGDDSLSAGQGNDRLYGGLGNDSLLGGDGQDVFVLEKGFGKDQIKDFNRRQDHLGLIGMDARQLTIVQKGNDTLIRAGRDELALLIGITASRVSQSMFVSATLPTL